MSLRNVPGCAGGSFIQIKAQMNAARDFFQSTRKIEIRRGGVNRITSQDEQVFDRTRIYFIGQFSALRLGCLDA